MRSQLGLNVPSPRTPIAAPTAIPVVEVDERLGTNVRLRMHDGTSSRSRPKGVRSAKIYSHIGPTAPVDVDTWVYQGETTRALADITFDPATVPGTVVWFTCQWANPRGETGPGSAAAPTSPVAPLICRREVKLDHWIIGEFLFLQWFNDPMIQSFNWEAPWSSYAKSLFVRMAKSRRSKRRPVLVQAIYPTATIGELVLKFDRAIDISAFDGTQIIVKDGLLLEARCDGTGPVIQADAQTVQIFLVALDDYFEPNDLLDASGATGIVAVDDGAEWAGVSGVGVAVSVEKAQQFNFQTLNVQRSMLGVGSWALRVGR